jgi:hypothetical protein
MVLRDVVQERRGSAGKALWAGEKNEGRREQQLDSERWKMSPDRNGRGIIRLCVLDPSE